MTFYLGLLSGFWLGILTSISPCPLATNIAAVSFLSKKFDKKLPLFLNGILYTVGRSLTYFLLSAVIINGLFSIPSVSTFLQAYVAKLLGPALILVGMFLLELLPFPSFGNGCGCVKKEPTERGYAGSFILGIFFALAFCPTSAAIFFGGMIPLALEEHSTIGIPLLYGIGTGIPVIVVAILIALGFAGIGRLFDRIIKFEFWIRQVTGVLFILIGLYYILTHILGII